MEGYLRIRTNRRSFTVQCDSLDLGVANFRGPNSEQRAKDCMARIMAVCEDYRTRDIPVVRDWRRLHDGQPSVSKEA